MNLRHKLLGATLAGLMTLGVGTAKADTVVPLVTPNTTITLTNATGKTLNGNVEFNQMGIQRGNGTMVPYSVPAFSEQTIPSPVTDTNILNSEYATVEPSTGNAEPIVAAFDCDAGNGHNVPTWGLDQLNNTQSQAGILTTGADLVIVASGTQAWNSSFTGTARGPLGDGNDTGPQQNMAPNSVVIAPANVIIGYTYPVNSSIQLDLLNNGSTGRAAILYTDTASLDTRVTEMKQFTVSTDPTAVVRAYIEKWLPRNDYQFYLSNKEIRAMINGDGHGTRSYSLDLAQILVKSPANTNGTTVDQMKQWILDQADGNLPNGELYHAFDPALWDNHNPANPALVFYEEPNAGLAEITLVETDVQTLYNLIKGDFLLQYVKNNPDQYGGNSTTGPDMNFNPTWNTQDPNQ